ncbi:proteasome complex subunit Rpn13 ubiquitin receptor-domain-containing protein [Mucor mucedo]|uniref:proteasome complex subunit Rpn13 ubiquitin receptor-domain-containing protein n=1 Tax=Mucor mucedo TaxID=29922 RepID=UPI00221E4275|nr:proteasome complex subunit Rpn13 ubiquitin receptor-domain-containing protein [Mucor mucedo]KAI7887913.1 proteasome complex subunit Rpn13 ubiquitin receptor-domain-containing protein [Mucor mucedo]
MSLFATAPTETHLVEFNAGKCIVEGTWIKPDLRKGKLYMDQGDDQLLHLYWKERKNQATPEDNMIIFPDEAEFKAVTQCTTGRVYVLKFKTSNESHFYWLQSKNDEKDQELVERVNELIRDPESNMNASSELDESTSHAELMRLLNGVENQDPNLTPENLLQFLNSMNGSADTQDDDDDDDEATTPPANITSTPAVTETPVVSAPVAAPAPAVQPAPAATAATAAPSNNQQSTEQLDQLRQMLANIRPAEGSAPISLSDVLTSQSLTPLLNDPEICASLFPFLPEESERSAEEVRQVVKSPQFSQALQSLSAALATGQLGPLLSQLGLDPSAGNSVESFLIAIGEQAKQKKNGDAMDED